MSLALSSALRRSVTRSLIPWFESHQRILPWRTRRTGYRVWLAELMLQQTRVDQVTPYYRRFLKRFPSLKALAMAPQSDVLKAWEGLGYYARARNLHRTAQIVHEEYGGRFPRTAVALQELPGIGPYTAAAIASLAFGADEAVVDGNVIRVMSRLMAFGESIESVRAKRQFVRWATELMPLGDAGRFNEAMMELGATVCVPRNPVCAMCPFTKVCRGKGDPHRFPVKKKKKRIPTVRVGAGIIRNSSGKMLIAQRKETGMLGSLWEFPGGKVEEGESFEACVRREFKEELGVEVSVGAFFMVVRHSYSHFKLEMHMYEGRLLKGRPCCLDVQDFAWVSLEDVDSFAWSKADLMVLAALRSREKIASA